MPGQAGRAPSHTRSRRTTANLRRKYDRLFRAIARDVGCDFATAKRALRRVGKAKVGRGRREQHAACSLDAPRACELDTRSRVYP